jgi:hypothetical protein
VHLPQKVALILFGAVLIPALRAAAEPGADILTNAAQIRSLDAARAAEAIPVHLRGVVIDQSVRAG